MARTAGGRAASAAVDTGTTIPAAEGGDALSGCLKNFANPAAHACPCGYHIGPGGACRGNGK
ncbi:hypothetical protein [Bradyrhizobium genosp. A]|uniref:hypothetical protein n=1 Tax=Bradyrhizobium genosp. A TaxID=83626 RepID=UPI003CEBFA9D